MRKVTPREITLVVATFAAVVVAAIWSFVIAPAIETRADSFATLRKIDGVWTIFDQLPTTFDVQTPRAAQPLRERVTTSAQATGIDIRRIDPQGAALSISLDAIAFTTLLGWVESLTINSGVRIFSAEIGRRPEPGIVSARIVLEDAL